MDWRPTRRALLGGAVLSGVAGCLPRSSHRAPDPDAALLRTARGEEESLLATYDAAIATAGAKHAAALRAIRAEHAAHLAALGGDRAATPTPTGAPAADLASAERTAARARAADALQAASPGHAQLLASIAASEASHADLLRGLTG